VPYAVYGDSFTYFISNNTLLRAEQTGPDSFQCYYAGIIASGSPATVSPAPGAIDWPSIKDQLKNSSPPGVQQDIQDIIKSKGEAGIATPSDAVPSTVDNVSSPPVITAADVAAAIRNIAQGAQVAAQQAAADAAAANDLPGVAAAIAAGNTADAINDNALGQAETAEAAEAAEVDKPEPETFDPVVAAPFESPYDPGSFDIPARFTTFLNNVKSTSLFSFSSSYFNSLPGGGSPIYTVEAGTYGTHTVDLSETMGTGLAVLKTVLLLLFGFLSIRVVILKR
ncbi:MAG: hypothetical protein RBR73_06015, partial [Halothiobacillaceae bacterium]|nr:hypothetical protein [Halothiobacillaceae bacterium]